MKKFIYLMMLLVSAVPLTVSAGTLNPFLDVLAWRASETSSYWAETISPALSPSNSVIHSSLDFNTRPGFKLGFIYLPESAYLDTTVYWTSYSSQSSQTIPTGNHIISSLFFSGSAFLSEGVFDSAYANWQMALNMVDVMVSHAYRLDTLTLTPKLGIKGGTINQSINIDWNALLYQASENATNNFTGIGPSFGLSANWNAYQHLSLVGDVSAALMYGRWNNSDTYHRPAAALGVIPELTNFTSMNHSNLGSLMMDYYLGLRWQHEGQSRVTFDLGYEMQFWSGQARWLSVEQFPTLGDLILQGATCGITIAL